MLKRNEHAWHDRHDRDSEPCTCAKTWYGLHVLGSWNQAGNTSNQSNTSIQSDYIHTVYILNEWLESPLGQLKFLLLICVVARQIDLLKTWATERRAYHWFTPRHIHQRCEIKCYHQAWKTVLCEQLYLFKIRTPAIYDLQLSGVVSTTSDCRYSVLCYRMVRLLFLSKNHQVKPSLWRKLSWWNWSSRSCLLDKQ